MTFRVENNLFERRSRVCKSISLSGSRNKGARKIDKLHSVTWVEQENVFTVNKTYVSLIKTMSSVSLKVDILYSLLVINVCQKIASVFFGQKG